MFYILFRANAVIIVNKKDLSHDEKQNISKYLGDGMATLEISNTMMKNHETIRKTVENVSHCRTSNGQARDDRK